MSRAAPTHRLYLVPSASHAIKGEKALLRAGVLCALIPVPRTVSSQCGVCLRVTLADSTRASEALTRAGIEVSGIHDLHVETIGREKKDEQSSVG